MCRRQHGTAFSSYAQIARADLHISAGAELIERFASSPDHERHFCRVCGSKLSYAASHAPELIRIAAGLFDDPLDVADSFHCYCASAASWYQISDSLPRFSADVPAPSS